MSKLDILMYLQSEAPTVKLSSEDQDQEDLESEGGFSPCSFFALLAPKTLDSGCTNAQPQAHEHPGIWEYSTVSQTTANCELLIMVEHYYYSRSLHISGFIASSASSADRRPLKTSIVLPIRPSSLFFIRTKEG